MRESDRIAAVCADLGRRWVPHQVVAEFVRETIRAGVTDPVLAEIFMPDYPIAEVSSNVKIRQLLSHTGGTGEIFVP